MESKLLKHNTDIFLPVVLVHLWCLLLWHDMTWMRWALCVVKRNNERARNYMCTHSNALLQISTMIAPVIIIGKVISVIHCEKVVDGKCYNNYCIHNTENGVMWYVHLFSVNGLLYIWIATFLLLCIYPCFISPTLLLQNHIVLKYYEL